MSRGGTTAVALTVAGSDSGGGAGIQADLKTFHALGVFGVSAVTAITCQNPGSVTQIQPVSPRIVAEQLDQIRKAFPIHAAKTGMLCNAGIAEVVAARTFKQLVVDPVLIASSGRRLNSERAVRLLLPQATVVTPNVPEAEILWGRKITDLLEAARGLTEKFGVPFLVKGGHFRGNQSIDVLSDGHEFIGPRLHVRSHGTGCVFSAAIAGHLALGCDLVEAIARAKRFITRALRDSVRIGKYHVLKI